MGWQKCLCHLIFPTHVTLFYFSNALTWRDVQYLLVYTSNTELTNTVSYDSAINGAGLRVSRDYGFGVIDAEAMVSRARHWINVPPQLEQTITPANDTG